MYHNYFEAKNDQCVCLQSCELLIHDHNVEVRPDGEFDALLFGSLLIIKDKAKKIVQPYTITLSTRVLIPIYSQDQWVKDEDNHYIISFEPGDIIIKHMQVPANIKNVSDIFNLLLGGNLSSLIPYHEYYDIFMNSMETNEKLGFPRVYLEILISELFTDETGKKPARLVKGSQGKPLSVKNAVMNSNTFNAITSEDWSKAMYLNKKKSKELQERNTSVLEQYLRK